MSGSTPTNDGAAGVPLGEAELPRASGPLTGEPAPREGEEFPPTRSGVFLKELLRGSAVTTFLAIVLAMIVGGILIAVTNKDVQAASSYFFARPGDTLVAIWQAVYNGYEALFRGAVFNARGADFAAQIRPLTNSLGFATPLIAAGLGVALAFRAGLFNIGARGQMLVGAIFAGLFAFNLDLPMWLHLPLTLLAGIVGGALWGGLVGLLKAKTGAHEVILTIMLNYVAFYLLLWMTRTPGLLQAPGTNQPQTKPTPASAQFPDLLGPLFPQLDWGFVVVLAATVFVWWLIERSSLGLRLRAVGENPRAA
ncbi:MAG: ABC transporter permease, partial [Microbacterium sp. 69-7]